MPLLTASSFRARPAMKVPGPSSTNAGEPWVMTVAASTHSGRAFANATVVNSPASVAGRLSIAGGRRSRARLQETGPVTDDLVAANPIDACAPLAPIGGKIGLIARGTCDFRVKLTNAVAAGRVGGAGLHELLDDGSENPKTIMGGDLTFPIPGVMIDNAPWRRDSRRDHRRCDGQCDACRPISSLASG